MKARISCVFLLLIVLAASGTARAEQAPGQAMATLKSTVDEVLAILKTPPDSPGRQEKLYAAASRVFDPEELARRTLGVHWQSFNPEERARFTSAFVKLLERTYLRRIQAYNSAQVVYLSQSSLSDTQAEVSTKIIANREVPVVYRLIKKNDWKVYDVVIEGVSLVQNYRNQFNQVLASQSPEQLISRIEAMGQAQ